MKTSTLPLRVLSHFSLLFVLLINSCSDDVIRTRTFHTKTAYYLTASALRAQSVAIQAPQELSVPGKIYTYGDYLFISEVNKGIHVVDNTNPSSPRFINFINIPGNADIAVNSNILYADSYVDLLAFDISNPAKIIPAKRVEDVFENKYFNKTNGIILGYKDTVITITETRKNKGNVIYDYALVSGASLSSSASKSYGTAGSTARFALMNDYLYTVDNSRLKLFNVTAPAEPKFTGLITIGTGIETIFPYQDKLFIGSNTGMHIYNASTPASPVKLSTYQHIMSCDPVVVQGKYAYVTLRSGTTCRLGSNLLDVVNIEDAAHPVLVSSFAMQNPHGLTISDSNLFICEGKFGLKTFDGADVLKIGQKQLSFITNINAVDIIAGQKSLIVTGADGIYQFDYSNPSALKMLSHLSLKNNL